MVQRERAKSPNASKDQPTNRLELGVDASANQLCAELEQLEQASVAAGCCEAVCQDMVATVCCRAHVLCCMLNFMHDSCRALSKPYAKDTLNTFGRKQLKCTLKVSLVHSARAVRAAVDEIYRWLLLPEQERHAAYAATEQLIMKHQTSLRNRFEDIALHVQYLPATCFTGQPDIPCSDVPQIRHRMHSLIEIPRIPHQQVLARATARLAPKPAPTQSQGGEEWALYGDKPRARPTHPHAYFSSEDPNWGVGSYPCTPLKSEDPSVPQDQAQSHEKTASGHACSCHIKVQVCMGLPVAMVDFPGCREDDQARRGHSRDSEEIQHKETLAQMLELQLRAAATVKVLQSDAAASLLHTKPTAIRRQ